MNFNFEDKAEYKKRTKEILWLRNIYKYCDVFVVELFWDYVTSYNENAVNTVSGHLLSLSMLKCL